MRFLGGRVSQIGTLVLVACVFGQCVCPTLMNDVGVQAAPISSTQRLAGAMAHCEMPGGPLPKRDPGRSPSNSPGSQPHACCLISHGNAILPRVEHPYGLPPTSQVAAVVAPPLITPNFVGSSVIAQPSLASATSDSNLPTVLRV